MLTQNARFQNGLRHSHSRLQCTLSKLLKSCRHRLSNDSQACRIHTKPLATHYSRIVVEPGRIELPTSCVQGRRSPS